ncbi:MAG: hypothetical protein IT163_00940 [Bryobacterales bacterium]|nr:hypothetical protein [Bryobacterales bacterium]
MMRPSLTSLIKAWVRAVIELRRRKRAGLPVEPVTVPLRTKQESPR